MEHIYHSHFVPKCCMSTDRAWNRLTVTWRLSVRCCCFHTHVACLWWKSDQWVHNRRLFLNDLHHTISNWCCWFPRTTLQPSMKTCLRDGSKEMTHMHFFWDRSCVCYSTLHYMHAHCECLICELRLAPNMTLIWWTLLSIPCLQ